MNQEASPLGGWDSERLSALVMNVPGAIYRCSPSFDWAMEFISETVEPITGYPAAEFVKNNVRTYASVIHPDDRAARGRGRAEALDRGSRSSSSIASCIATDRSAGC